MADTHNLDLLLMEVGAPNREVVVNNGLIVLDTITSGVLSLDVSGAGDYPLTDTLTGEAKQGSLMLTGVLTGDRVILVPDRQRQYLVHNGTTGAFTLTVKTVSGGGVTIGADTWAFLISDGTNVLATVTGGGGGTLPSASETQAGVIEIATTAETTTGTDDTRAVTPLKLQQRLTAVAPPAASETVSGLIELATTAEVQTGTDAVRAVTPAGLTSRTATETRAGVLEVATQAEVTTGTDDTRALTPLKLATRIAAIPAVPAASETVAGVVELATAAEVQALTDLTRALSPGRLASLTPVDTRLGLIELATQAEVTTGTDAVRAVTPLTLATRIAAIPAASETVAGVVELATQAEVTTGTDATRAVTPAGLAAKLPAGTPYSVTRYAAAGTALEAAPLSVNALGEVTATATAATTGLTVSVQGIGQTTPLLLDAYTNSVAAALLSVRKARGTPAVPGKLNLTTDQILNLASWGYVRNAADTADTWVSLAQLRTGIESLDAQGRAGAYTSLWHSPGGSAVPTEALRVTSAGNLLLGLTTHGTGLAKGLVLASGTAPSTVPADAVQMWVEDRAGVAGKGSLLMRVEDNTSHVFGDLVGLGRVTPEASLHVEQTTTSGALAAKLETFSNAVTSMGAVVTIKRRTPGDMGDGFGPLLQYAIEDNAASEHVIGRLGWIRNGADNSGLLTLASFNAGTASAEVVFDHQGNLSFRGTGGVRPPFGAGAVGVLMVPAGTAPATSPPNAVQLWVADRGGVAGKGSLHLRTEDGTSHVLGDASGIGTLGAATLGSGASYQALNVNGSTLYVGQSSVQERPLAALTSAFVVSTDATRTARLTLSAYDATAAREGLRLEADGTGPRLAFYGATAVVKPTVSGSRGGNAALASALTALATLGLITDGTTA